MLYQLPTDPSIISEDPLGILDAENPPQAQVLSTLLETAVQSLSCGASTASVVPTLIEDIAYTIHRNGSLPTDGLRRFLSNEKLFADSDALIILLRAAKALSLHHLTVLGGENTKVTFSGAQVNSLLAHQFLGTLHQPKGTTWGLPDFTSWFTAEQAHAQAVDGYLQTILAHFAAGGYPETEEFSFYFHTAAEMPEPAQNDSAPDVRLRIVTEESEPSAATDHPFVLVAAHSQPGPGATATQEERLQSASPALSISALVIPVISQDAVVVTSPFSVHALWRGHNRTARMEKLLNHEERPRRHYILADALQMDEMEDDDTGLKDLLHGRPTREVKKLFAAFAGASKACVEGGTNYPCTIETGAWGCGAFGGNVLFKTVCMMIAAGLTGVELQLSLLKDRHSDVQQVRSLLDRRLTTRELWEAVTHSQTHEDLLRSLTIAEDSPKAHLGMPLPT